MIYRYDIYYCVIINLFSFQHHDDVCCNHAIAEVDDDSYTPPERAWWPDRSIKIAYTLDGDNWITYHPNRGDS